MKTITVSIAETGEVRIDAVGFKGSACERATAEIERALGVVGNKGKKPEYYQAEATQTQKAGH